MSKIFGGYALGSRGLFAFASVVATLLVASAHAQVGNDNPTGPSGEFGDVVTTGCSYSAYPANAFRSITDIMVAGSVGQYPLAFTRTMTSRYIAGVGTEFGAAGSWRHSWQWSIASTSRVDGQGRPRTYVVNYPDGRQIVFSRDLSGVDPYFRGLPGIRDRLEQLSDVHPNDCYVRLPDGGKVWFQATLSNGTWRFAFKGIIDPYNQTTTVTYPPDGSMQITEPAGRWLKIFYRTITDQSQGHVGDVVIGHLLASDNRTVYYTYTAYVTNNGTRYTSLTQVRYYSDARWDAFYTYQGSNDPNIPSGNGRPLIRTCNDSMYAGPMKRIAYQFKDGHDFNGDNSTPVYGQIWKEQYWDGDSQHLFSGPVLSTLAITYTNVRVETRADTKTRTFAYLSGGYLYYLTDFLNHIPARQGYDTQKYVNYVTDRNGHRTDYTRNALNGNVTQIQFPASAAVTPAPDPRGTINYTYGSPGCADTNNQDANNPYYACTATDEAGHVTQFYRDYPNHRITQINYPDGGYETFSYNSFGQVLSHRMTTGGTETFTYDNRGLRQTYRSPDSPSPSPSPSARYQYDGYDRLSYVTDVLGASLTDSGHTTSYAYNRRGQVSQITLPIDPVDGNPHTIKSWYNPDGTMYAHQNEMYQTTHYTYDDYRRLKSVQTPVRGWGDNGTNTTSYYYDASATGDDYSYTDSNATYAILPSGKTTKTDYDDDRRRWHVTVGYNTADAAMTTYGYDNVGNLTSITNPLNHNNVATLYDERNRSYSIAVGGQTPTTFTYDTAGRKKTITRPNGQLITNETFDAMNRVTYTTATQTPTGTARTNYEYYAYGPANLLHKFQDPRIYTSDNSGEHYTYTYDGMGRKQSLTYPAEPPPSNAQRVESWHYDKAGRLDTYTNRANNHQSFTYDGLNRVTDFGWDDSSTPGVHFDYDTASRLTGITNANATVTRGYYYDDLLRVETETATGGVARSVSYTYDPDGNQNTLSIPGYSFTYDYTNRNQVKTITDNGSNITSSFWYDKRGNVTQRNPGNGTTSSYTPDTLDRVTQIVHTLNGTTRTVNYGYYDNSNNRKWTQRLVSSPPNSPENNKGEVFAYDLADQATAVQVDIANPNTADPGSQSILYDSNGNRTWYAPPGANKEYDPPDHVASKLNQYTSVKISGTQYNLGYVATGNLGTYNRNNSSYNYDAQNRLTSATVNSVSMSFKYDGLNRQVSRTIGSNTEYSAWDGWDLVQEYHVSSGNAVEDASYLYGPTGLVKNLTTNRYYYQDASGSTSHLADSTGHLVEWYRYDLDGMPSFYNPNDTRRNPNQSGFGVRHLFTGQQWYQELGLYDLRNRFYSPDLGRFLQPDPKGFKADPTNLYRYCRNNPVKWRDPTGLDNAAVIYYALNGRWPAGSIQTSTGITPIGAVVGYVGGVALVYYTAPFWIAPAAVVAAGPLLESDVARDVMVNAGEDAEKIAAAAEELFRQRTAEVTSAQADIEPPELTPIAVPGVADPNAPPGANPSGPPAPQYAGAGGPGVNLFSNPGPVGFGWFPQFYGPVITPPSPPPEVPEGNATWGDFDYCGPGAPCDL